MRRWIVLGFALVVGAAVAGGGHTARAADARAGASVDLSGTWRFDPEQSDMPGRDGRGPGMRGGFPGGEGGRGGYPGGGGGGMRGGMGGGGMRPPDGMRRPQGEGGPGDSLRRRPPGPPMVLRIHQQKGVLEFTDSTGTVMREIDTTGDASTSDTMRAGGAAVGVQRMHGQWKNQRLETRRWDWRGTKRTETYRLEDKGRTLVVETHVEIEGRGTRTMKHVYHRVGG